MTEPQWEYDDEAKEQVTILEQIGGPRDGQQVRVPKSMIPVIRQMGLDGGYRESGEHHHGFYKYDEENHRLTWVQHDPG